MINFFHKYLNFTLLNNTNLCLAMKQEKVTEDNMQHLMREDRSVNLYNDWCIQDEDEKNIHQVLKSLTYKGVFKYSLQLIAVEVSTIVSIYLIRAIIDYL